MRHVRTRGRGLAAGAVTLTAAITLITTMPGASQGGTQNELGEVGAALERTVDRVAGPSSELQQGLRDVEATVKRTTGSLGAAAQQAAAPAAQPASAQGGGAETRVPTTEPQTTPALNGTNPHGQGTVADVKLDPSNERPQAYDPSGSTTGEIVKAGQARGEQNADGSYRGHITIAALLGQEILGVSTTPGQTEAGPLDPVQTALLDSICTGSANNVCLSLVTADSTTTATGTTNRFAVANAAIGGPGGLTVAAAESTGDATNDANCQTTTGTSRVANVTAASGVVANAVESRNQSVACRGQAPVQTTSSSVLGLGGSGIPLPAAGCESGAPDTVTGIPVLLPIVCNRDDSTQAQAPNNVREALAIFAVAAGSSSLLETVAGSSETVATAPAAPPAPTPTPDDDGDGTGVEGAGGESGSDGTGDGDGGDGTGAGNGDDGAGDGSGVDGDRADSGARNLAFTGANVLGLVLGGVLMILSGLVLRRRVLVT